jgi:hypothetical protein
MEAVEAVGAAVRSMAPPPLSVRVCNIITTPYLAWRVWWGPWVDWVVRASEEVEGSCPGLRTLGLAGWATSSPRGTRTRGAGRVACLTTRLHFYAV